MVNNAVVVYVRSVTQLCLTLCYRKDCSPPGSSAHGMLQARVLEWAAISSSRGFSRLGDWAHVSCIFCFGRWVLYYCATWEARYSCYTGPIFFFFFNFLAVLGLHRCVQTFSSCVEWWLFSSCRTQALGRGLSNCGTRLSCSVACGGFWD